MINREHWSVDNFAARCGYEALHFCHAISITDRPAVLSERDDVAECAVKERGVLLIVVFTCRPRKEPHRRSGRNFSHLETRRLILGDALRRATSPRDL